MSISQPDGQLITQKFYYPRREGSAAVQVRKHVILINSYLHFSLSSFHKELHSTLR